jgi:hypothetical protein
MPKLNMMEEVHFVNLLAPVDIVATATVSKYVSNAQIGNGQMEFEVQFGVVTSTDSTGEVIVTFVGNDVNDTTSSDNNEVAVAGNYRISGAVGTDTMGALTAFTSAGVAFAQADDGKTLLAYVDPAVLQQKYVRAVITPTTETTVCVVGVNARYVPRKAQASQASSS